MTLFLTIVAVVILGIFLIRKSPKGTSQNNQANGVSGGNAQQPPTTSQSTTGSQRSNQRRKWGLPSGGTIFKLFLAAIVVVAIVLGLNYVPTQFLRWGGLIGLALLGGFMAWKSKSWVVRVIGGILVLPIIIVALSGPSAGDRFADNLGKTVVGVSNGVGNAGKKLSEFADGEESATGAIKLKGEMTTVWLDGHWRNMPIPSGTCTLTSPGSLIEFEFPNPTLTRMRSRSGEKIQATVTMKPYGSC